MKFFDLYNEFYFKFVLLTNQLFNKFETNKIHDLKKKLIIKFKLIMNNLNDYTFFENFHRKIQTIDNRHQRIKNDDDKNQISLKFFQIFKS